MKRIVFGFGVSWLLAGAVAGHASEPSRVCFRSVAEAVAQAAEAAVTDEGFRLESVRWDPMMGRSWASVASCAHPERPAVTVAVAGATLLTEGTATQRIRTLENLRTASPAGQAAATPPPAPATPSRPLVDAGASVRLVRLEANVRLEAQGIAQASGRLGERIRVRVLPVGTSNGDSSQLETLVGVVRGAGLLELEP